MPDLGIFASTDLVAIDQACIDLVYSLPDFIKHTFVKRIESREDLRQLSAMKEIGLGTGDYRIVRVLDKKTGSFRLRTVPTRPKLGITTIALSRRH